MCSPGNTKSRFRVTENIWTHILVHSLKIYQHQIKYLPTASNTLVFLGAGLHLLSMTPRSMPKASFGNLVHGPGQNGERWKVTPLVWNTAQLGSSGWRVCVQDFEVRSPSMGLLPKQGGGSHRVKTGQHSAFLSLPGRGPLSPPLAQQSCFSIFRRLKVL